MAGDAPGGGRHSVALGNGIVRCDLCPHHCRLREGQRGICFARQALGGRIALPSHGRVSSVAADPIEKKPLYHFLPGTRSLSIGTIGCNLSCRFCQNWPISKPRDESALDPGVLPPEEVAAAAVRTGCASVSFTYNEPLVTFEYTLDAARACRARGLRTVAVTAGYVEPAPRAEFFGLMDAANVDLKAFREDFYRKLCGAHLAPVLETLEYVKRETACWLEVTTLLIPGENDGDAELDALSRWCVERLGPDTPLHFSAFHPQYRMEDHAPTPPATLAAARQRARANGARHVYAGNVRDAEGGRTSCAGCGAALVERDGFRVLRNVLRDGGCPRCGAPCAGVWA